MTPAEDALLSVQDLAVSVDRPSGRLDLYSGLSFDLHAGEVIALTGENGAGKSTLGRVLTGLTSYPVRVVKGRVLYLGRNILGLSDRELVALRRDAIRLVLQEGVSALDPVESVGWQLHAVLRAKGVKNRADRSAQIRSMLADLGLPDERLLNATAAELSGGQGKRVVIAQTLLSRPKVIVADEVTAGLDLIRAREVVDILVDRARGQGCGVIMVSHDPMTVGQVANRVLRLERPLAVGREEAVDA
jgi:ABC-type glutathione transport system ATPase component